MRKSKKLVAALVSLNMAAAVFAPVVTVQAEDGEISGKVELWNDKMAQEDPAIPDAIMKAATEVSGIEVSINSYPDVAAYQTAVQQSVKEPEAPGMFTWWSGSQLETLAQNGMVEDLTEVWEKYIIPAGVPENVADAFTVDGKIYAAPYCVLYNTVMYNMECFEEAGITKLPETFDEFLEVCEKLKTAGITPIGLKNDSWASFIWFQQLIAAYEPQLYEDLCTGTRPYTDPDVKKVMEIWKDMFDKGYFAEPVTVQDVRKNLATGKIGMHLDASLEVPVMNRDYGMVSEENFSAFPLPSMNEGKDTIFFEASPICVASASADKDSAKKVMETWYGPEVQTIYTDDLGMANTSAVAATDPTLNKITALTEETESYELHLRFYENTPEDLRNYAIDELSRFMYSGADIDEVLGNIQNKADETFGK